MDLKNIEQKLQQATALLQVCLKELGSSSGIATTSPGPVASSAIEFDPKRLAVQLGISSEQIAELYEFRDDKIYMHVKPLGHSVADKQRLLAHALLVAYKFGRGLNNVRLSALHAAADEWGLKGGHFSRDIQDKYVQLKGGGKGSDPLVSLAPGAIDHIKEGIRALVLPSGSQSKS
jgi:hypothetical protein